jgi:catechol 2,3-dioxygenase-like lactoylglutathione lyase family enzyme
MDPAVPFESLDYLYLPAPDIEASVKFYTEGLGGELLAVYQLLRPGMDQHFSGRFDT